MSEHPAPLWRDPLFSPGDRFPLGPPRGIMDNCHEGPSDPETRPFSLRHVVAGARLNTPPTWRYTYCHERQVALIYDEDGSPVPLLKHTQPGATPSPGTSATPDGDPKNPPPEEMLPPDHQND
ncbi:MAG: putative ATP-grasp-modified RiPP [Pseudonocardiaceae bacterium]